MKPWQKKYFRKHVEWAIPEIIDLGYAKTEEEAYSLFKRQCRLSYRGYYSDGHMIVIRPKLKSILEGFIK